MMKHMIAQQMRNTNIVEAKMETSHNIENCPDCKKGPGRCAVKPIEMLRRIMAKKNPSATLQDAMDLILQIDSKNSKK